MFCLGKGWSIVVGILHYNWLAFDTPHLVMDHPHICAGLFLSNNMVKDQDAGAVCAGQCGVELAAHSLVAWQGVHEINGKSQVLETPPRSHPGFFSGIYC